MCAQKIINVILFSFAIFCIGLKVSSKSIFSMYLCSRNE